MLGAITFLRRPAVKQRVAYALSNDSIPMLDSVEIATTAPKKVKPPRTKAPGAGAVVAQSLGDRRCGRRTRVVRIDHGRGGAERRVEQAQEDHRRRDHHDAPLDDHHVIDHVDIDVDVQFDEHLHHNVDHHNHHHDPADHHDGPADQGVTFTLTPDTEQSPYTFTTTKGPLLAWSVANAARVQISDNKNVFTSTKPTGSARVCPGHGDRSASARATPGVYTYTLDVFNAANQRVLHRTMTLTITAAP